MNDFRMMIFITVSGNTHLFRGGMKANTTFNNIDAITQMKCTKPTGSGYTPMKIRRS